MSLPTVDAFVLLLYLVPGFLATQVYSQKYPAKRLTRFEVLVWSVIHSFIVHLILGGIGKIFGASGFNVYTGESSTLSLLTVAILILGGLGWGFILILYHWCRIKIPILPTPDPQAIWPVAAAGSSREQLWALARTKNGHLYMGWIDRYSFDPAAEDHDFLLCPAYLVNDSLEVIRDLVRGGVYLNTRDLEALERIPGQENDGT